MRRRSVYYDPLRDRGARHTKERRDAKADSRNTPFHVRRHNRLLDYAFRGFRSSRLRKKLVETSYALMF